MTEQFTTGFNCLIIGLLLTVISVVCAQLGYFKRVNSRIMDAIVVITILIGMFTVIDAVVLLMWFLYYITH